MHRSIMLATLLELLGIAGGGGWTTPGAEEDVRAADRRVEMPSAIDEEEFQMLMMQVSMRIGFAFKFLNPYPLVVIC
jgi:hypothetical protein